MSKKKEDDIFFKTNPDLVVEVVRIKIGGPGVRRKKMSFKEFINMQKIQGYIYKCYQVGFCTIQEENE